MTWFYTQRSLPYQVGYVKKFQRSLHALFYTQES